jgi:hypothetical protein
VLLLAVTSIGGLSASHAQSRAGTQPPAVVRIAKKALDAAPVFDVSSTVVRELTSDGAIENIEYVSRAEFTSPSTFVLLERSPTHIHVVSLGNSRIGHVGRTGAGPGEFRFVTDISVRGDTLMLLDPALLRLSFFETKGNAHVRSRIKLPSGFSRIAGVLPNGAIVLHNSGSYIERDLKQPTRTTANVIAVPPVGEPQPLLRIPDVFLKPVEAQLHRQRETLMLAQRLSSSSAVVVVGDQIVATSTDKLTFTVYDANARPVRTILVDRPLRAVTARMRSLAVKAELEMYRNSREKPPNMRELERVVTTAPYRDSLPAIHSILQSRAGVLWLVEGIGPGDPGWTALGFRVNGELVGRIESRSAGEPLAISESMVVTREEDATGMSVLRVRRIAPRR